MNRGAEWALHHQQRSVVILLLRDLVENYKSNKENPEGTCKEAPA